LFSEKIEYCFEKFEYIQNKNGKQEQQGISGKRQKQNNFNDIQGIKDKPPPLFRSEMIKKAADVILFQLPKIKIKQNGFCRPNKPKKTEQKKHTLR
jgi:hypothetical protein